MFWAWGRWSDAGLCIDNVVPTIRSIGPAPTGVHRYTVVRTSSEVDFKIDGIIKEHIPIDDVQCWDGSDVTADGETWDRGDQLGGLVGDRQNYTSAIYEATVGGSWTSPGFTTCDSDLPSIYMCSRPAGNAIDLWTDRS